MEQLILNRVAHVETLLSVIMATPFLHRKDVQRILGISDRTLSRRLRDPRFPRPTYDAGRPKWRPTQFLDGQTAGQSTA